MVFRGEHDRRSDQASLVPSRPLRSISLNRNILSHDMVPELCVLQGREFISARQGFITHRGGYLYA